MSKKTGGHTFGAELRRMREREGLSVAELAKAVNMKPGYVEDLESGKALPHVAEILTLSRMLAMDPASFMGAEPAKGSPGRRKKALAMRTDDYAYETLTEDEPDKHLMGFRVTIDPKSRHKKVGYQHEGEEFIHVLSGKLKITVAGKSRSLGEGQSIRFDSGLKHQLVNPGKEPAVLLVVIYTP